MKMLCSTIGILASVQYNSKYVSSKMPFEKMSHHKRHIYDILESWNYNLDNTTIKLNVAPWTFLTNLPGTVKPSYMGGARSQHGS